MAGKKGRSGRYRPYQTYDVNRLADLSLKAMIRALEDDSIPLLDRARLAQPIVAKRFPDKHEILSLSVSISPDQAGKLLELYERNLLVLKELELSKVTVTQPHVEAQVSPVQDQAASQSL